MESCIFCKIAAGQIPAHVLYQDDNVLCLLDVQPVVRGHALVIPRRHVRNVLEIPGLELAKVAAHLPALSRAIIAAVAAPACHVLLNNGAAAMQSVEHLHFHIIPRRAGDVFQIPWPAGRLEPADAAALAANVREKLAAEP